MRRPLRLIFNGTGIASALLTLAICLLWVRSYWRADAVTLELLRVVPGSAAPGPEYFCYSIESADGGAMYFMRRGTFGMDTRVVNQKFQSLTSKAEWSYQCSPSPTYPQLTENVLSPPLARLGIGHESVWFVHAGNLDAVEAWVLPYGLLAIAASVPAVLWLVFRHYWALLF